MKYRLAMPVMAAGLAIVLLGGCNDTKSNKTVQSAKSTSVTQEKSAPAAETAVQKSKEVINSAASETKEAVSRASDTIQKQSANIEKKVKETTKKVVAATTAAIAPETIGVNGSALFASKCAGCHGKDAKKHALGKSNIIAGESKDEIAKKLKGYKAKTFGGSMKAIMQGQASSLSDAQIDALAAYISKLK